MDGFLGNKPSFLAEQKWQQTMRKAICSDESLAGQGDFVLLLWMHLVNGPKRFQHATDLITSPTPPPQHAIDNLIDEISGELQSLKCWLQYSKQWNSLREAKLPGWTENPGSPLPILRIDRESLSPAHATQLTLRGTYVGCVLLKSRLLVALAPTQFGHLEAECQELSRQIMALNTAEGTDEVSHIVCSLVKPQSAWLAKGVLATEQIWAESLRNQEEIVEKWKFEAWCTAIKRRPLCTG